MLMSLVVNCRADGSVEVHFPLPETTVPYVINAYAMHPERGLQIARQFIQVLVGSVTDL